MEFTVLLEDKTITEGEDVTLECTVTKPDLTAEWRKDGSPVEASKRIKPKSADKTKYLLIANVGPEDSADYEVTVGDASSKIPLTVEGKLLF